MSWNGRIITEQELEKFSTNHKKRDLASRVAALFEQQRQTWAALSEGYDALAAVETKRFMIDESTVIAQHNPRRIRSTAARVDDASVRARQCFLCPSSLPPDEKGIAYGPDLVILCNPFPVLDRHLSIVHRDHVRQQISGNIETLLALAYDLGPDYFLLYNGPECGASAPDHLHFQACSRSLLPIEDDIKKGDPAPVEACEVCDQSPREEFELFTVSSSGRAVVVFRSTSGDDIALWVYETLSELAKATGKQEPMVNIICTREERFWTIYLFPRARHRPACYFAEGGERLTISPGAIDMAGVVVIPDRADFERIEAGRLVSIFSEVSYDPNAVNEIIERVCQSSAAEELW